MDPLSVTASIIAILQLSSKVVGYLTNVKDASKERATCAVEVSSLHSLLLNLRFHLEDGNANTTWHTAVRALAVENGPLDQFKQALETLQDKMTDRGHIKKAKDVFTWKFKKEEVDSILGRIERLKTLVEIALQQDHFKLSQAIKDDTQNIKGSTQAIKSDTQAIKSDAQTIKSDLNSVRAHEDNAERRQLLEWISSTDYSAQQSDIIKRRQEGTGEWFLAAPQVATWLSEPRETLFCPGNPGTGKTMVAAIAIDYLLKSMQSSSHGVAYVYCNYKAYEEQDTSRMLAAILKQLVQARPSLAEPLQRLHKQHASRGTRPSLDEVFSALQDVLSHYTTIYIVVDALDECQDSDGARRQFLNKLRHLQRGQDVRLMVTSRFIPEIVDAFNGDLKLEVQASKEDVKRFVAGQMYRLPICIQRDPKLQKIVQEKIAEAVDGMFLLARLHTDSLQDNRTPKDVKSTLDKLSRGSAALEKAYKEAIQRIKDQLPRDYKLAKKVLSWITYAKRPLTTTEMCCALAVELDKAELDPENIHDAEDLLSVCAGLVVVDQESAVIRLVHYTTQEYFERIRDAWDPDAQLQIASTCLTYLSFSTFKIGICSSDKEFEKRLQESQFLDYAAKHWGEHAAIVEDQICELACSFLSNNELVSCATQVLHQPMHKFRNYSQEYHKGHTGLHLTARFGLSIVLEAMLFSQENDAAFTLGAKDRDGHTLLYLAAEHGQPKIAKLLLEMGADVNMQGGKFGNALCAASWRGHEQIVKLLLEKGADVNAQDGRFGSALQVASYEGHKQIVKLLLEKDALNAKAEAYGNSLEAASYGGHEQIVKLLLEKGADVNAQGEEYNSALYAASYRGYEQIVKLLLEKGADVNAQGEEYNSALYAAASGGHEQTVKLLLNAGADINGRGRSTAAHSTRFHFNSTSR